MAGNFKQTRFSLIAIAGISLLLWVCPGANAQQPADGSPQTAQPADGSPQTAQPANGAPKAAPAPPKGKQKPQSTPKKAKKKPAPATIDASAEPDKVLYDRAQKDLKGGRYTEGRLALQTLINTYPDSEYLAKAKLAVADSYYKEGGTSSTTQAIQEYKDFITFFPFLDEAAYAQMQVGMAHFRMMEKADRDSTQAQAAEDEFQAFILKYPQSPLLPKAEQYLREVQEVLADAEYRIGHYYYMKADYRAAAARLLEVTDRYPLYSGTDEALWMLGNVYSRAKLVSKNEDDKNHWGDLAAKCYDRILEDYPLSKRAVDAKARLQSMAMPVPAADPDAYMRMRNDQLYAKQHHQSAVLKMPMEMLRSNPDVSAAARSGTPQLNPPNDAVSATDVLRPGATGPSFTIAGAGGTADPGTGTGGDTTPVDAVPQSSPGPTDAPGNSTGFQIISAPNDPNASAAANTTAAPPPADTPAAPANSVPVINPASADPKPATGDSGAAAASAAPGTGTPANGAPVTNSANAGESTSTAPQGGSTVPAPGSAAAAAPAKATQTPATDPKKESTSKKKKGVKKLIPW
jgi:outer membrane protein assembly factor BamD